MLAKDLYKELGFEAGKSQDEFTSYRQEIETSNINFEMLPIKGGNTLWEALLQMKSEGRTNYCHTK